MVNQMLWKFYKLVPRCKGVSAMLQPDGTWWAFEFEGAVWNSLGEWKIVLSGKQMMMMSQEGFK